MATGVWLIGARGSIAVTTIVGAAALRAGLAETVGCVTELPAMRSPSLPALADLTFGGHDVAVTPLSKRAETLGAAGVLPASLLPAVRDDLAATEPNIRPVPSGANQAEAAALLVEDIEEFRRSNRLHRVVVVNVASTEAPSDPHPAHAGLAALRAAMRAADPLLAPSSLYAYAAFQAGCPYVDFTPSTGARLPALAELADQQRLPYAGHDGKTGETLVKSVLAPMFARRNLRVRSWSGTNLLGGGDGATLADPRTNAAKTMSKQRVVTEVLGYTPQGRTRIEFVDDIGDFKTAWDLITFSGFLGTGMRMEFTWHGCDSALAAPLVLDLARLVATAHAAGRTGPLTDLAFFFKDPLGTGVPHDLAEQWERLCRFAAELSDAA